MSSTNYYIYSDAIDTGGILSTSSAYSLQDTVDSSGAGMTTSSSYIIRGGFQHAELGSLALTIGTASVSLGTLSSGSVNSGSSVITVDTNSDSGYTLSITSVSGTSLTGVADGSVTAGSEEYGFAVSGTHAAFAGDKSPAANLVVASSLAPASSDQTILTFKAAMAVGSNAGSYNQTITFTAAANF